MDMTQQNDTAGASAPAREIPVPPGGGSWTFNESTWKWVSNDPTPALEAPVDSDAAGSADATEQEQ